MADTFPATGTTAANIPLIIKTFYSKDIEHKAQPTLRFAQFAVTKTDFGVEPGNTVNFTQLNSIPRGIRLDETEDVPVSKMSATDYALTVYEYGNAIVVSQRLLFSSMTDVLAEAAILLGFDYAVVLDILLRDTAHTTTNDILAKKSDGTDSSTRDDVGKGLTTLMVDDAVELLATNNCPLFGNDFLVGVISPRQYSQIKKDPDWRSSNEYAGSGNIFNGEVGSYNMVRFIQTTVSLQGDVFEGDANNNCAAGWDSWGDYANNGLNAANSLEFTALGPLKGVGVDHGAQALTTNLHTGMIFGDRAYALGVGNPVELRDNGVENFGRRHGIAWIAVMNAGLLESGVNITNIVSAHTPQSI